MNNQNNNFNEYDVYNNNNNNLDNANNNQYNINNQNQFDTQWSNTNNNYSDSQNSNTQDFYTSNFTTQTTDFNTNYQDNKKQKRKGKFIGLTLALLLASTTCGFAGSIIANEFINKPANENGKAVIKESIINTANTAGSTSTVAQVVNSVVDSVVEISTETVKTNTFLQQYISEGAGSGVVISENGYIITNHHVIENASKIQVRTRNGNTYDAKLIGTDAESDLAVIKIEENGLKYAVFGDSDKLAIGEQAIAVGNPLGQLGGTVTEGIISALDREINIEGQTMTLLQTSAAINPGNSGGGLFNSSGELIGVVNAKTSASGIEGLGFAIPSNTAKNVSSDLIEHGYVSGKVKLGVSMIDISDKITAAQYNVTELGVYIAQVSANSDAYYGGLKAGDRIISVNGKEIQKSSELKEIVENSKVGDKLSFLVQRGNSQTKAEITLTEYNSTAAAFGNTQNQ